ncbi:phage tail assembly chaperone [Caballeronia sp. ATUFL_F1_KS39]|uniref:phage tail assembly chaperone n=1 Tax=Caballeronia sp. ATUFL_F1_KS39 TaxID=2921766 RepID=UPI0020297A20|nr:phage tail assembly chaperone [Caballeronia sp. ATUFL_F1_KS39]
MSYITNDELIYLTQLAVPDAVPGLHYAVTCQYDRVTNEPLCDATYTKWTYPGRRAPSRAKIKAIRAENDYETFRKGDELRLERARRFVYADALVGRALDSGDDAALAKASEYRQALRDVPQQAGFPDIVQWPVAPDAKEQPAALDHDDGDPESMLNATPMQPDPIPVTAYDAEGKTYLTTDASLAARPEPMYQYGNLETGQVTTPHERRKPIVPDLGPDGRTTIETDDDEPLPHSPGYEESIPLDYGISKSTVQEEEPSPFVPSPQPPIEALGQPDVQATTALADDPVAKLQAFLAANPDVVSYIEANTPAPEPQPEPDPDDGGTTT